MYQVWPKLALTPLSLSAAKDLLFQDPRRSAGRSLKQGVSVRNRPQPCRHLILRQLMPAARAELIGNPH